LTPIEFDNFQVAKMKNELMKAEIHIDSEAFVDEIVRRVTKALKPRTIVGKSDEEALYTVESLAKFLEVSPQWVYARVQFNEIPHFKVGKLCRFRKVEINRWLDSHKVPAVNPLSKTMRMTK